ncbi:MAG: hypothetical protein WBD31_09690 [Rubripirellula sp.]
MNVSRRRSTIDPEGKRDSERRNRNRVRKNPSGYSADNPYSWEGERIRSAREIGAAASAEAPMSCGPIRSAEFAMDAIFAVPMRVVGCRGGRGGRAKRTFG